MKIRVTRRQIALGLLAVAGGAAGYWQLVAEDRTPLDLELPPGGNPFAPSFGEFVALSQIVLARPRLDESAARLLHEVFLDEPWGPKHIGHAYAILRAELVRSHAPAGAYHPISLSALESGERWFVGHLVTTWYLGIYYHEERPTRRVLYEAALMFDSIRGKIPVPFIENLGFGAWTEPPGRDDEVQR